MEDSWVCSTCTYFNFPEHTHCDMCFNVRELKAVVRIGTKSEATKAVDNLMEFFDHDVNKLLSFAGSHMKNRKPIDGLQLAAISQDQAGGIFGLFSNLFGALNDVAGDWWNQDFGGVGDFFGYDNQAELAAYERSMEEILAEIEAFELDHAKSESLKVEAEMTYMQETRRRESMMLLNKRLSSATPDGRRLSRMDAKNIILESAMEIAAQEEQEDVVLQEDVEEDDEEPEPADFLYLPYIAIEGDLVDEAIAACVNNRDIDLHISRPDASKKKSKKTANKRNYKVCGQTYNVRCIHGLLIAKLEDSSKWDEFAPVLEQLYEDSKK